MSETDVQAVAVAPSHHRRRRTKVGWGTKIFVGLVGVGILALVGLSVFSGGPEGTDVRSMTAGQCYVETAVVQEHGRPIPYGKDAPCLTSSPRVVAVISLPLGPYPGTAALTDIVFDRCGNEQTHVVSPTAESWADGDRRIACLYLP